jgi:HAD superfamily hydrolase (TIGR01509 family)
MDGVVVDSERHWVPLENDRILPRVVDGAADPSASEITGMHVADAYAYLDHKYGTTVSLTEFVAAYDDAAEVLYDDRVTLLAGFDALLDAFAASDVAVALVSSSPHHWIDRVLDRFGLHDAFDVVVSGDDVDGESKPAPDVYEHAADRLDVDPSRAVAVEDSAHGLAAARAAGMHVVGYQTASNADLEFRDAHEVAVGPARLHEVLDTLAMT